MPLPARGELHPCRLAATRLRSRSKSVVPIWRFARLDSLSRNRREILCPTGADVPRDQELRPRAAMEARSSRPMNTQSTLEPTCWHRRNEGQMQYCAPIYTVAIPRTAIVLPLAGSVQPGREDNLNGAGGFRRVTQKIRDQTQTRKLGADRIQ
jgi:hypothetical protein